MVNGVKCVCPDHTDFIYYNKVKGTYQLYLLFPELKSFAFLLRAGYLWSETQLEERVDSSSLGIYGGYTCRGDNHHAFWQRGPEIT